MPLELKEQIIDLLKPKGNQNLQITFDEDVNVPDIKPDIDKILQSHVQISILKEELLTDKLDLQGEVKVSILYAPLNDKKLLHNINTVIPFQEIINVDGITSKDNVKVDHNIEDFKICTVNSRKLNLKSITQFRIHVNEKKEVHITADINEHENIEKNTSSISFCQLKESSKESYTIKDELAIPSGKPNIMEILWHDMTIQNKDIKLLNGKINLKGTLHLATLYAGENSENSLEFVEHDLSFNGLIDCYECKEDMIHDIDLNISEENIQIRPDIDGEERVLEVKVDTKVDIKVYNEEEAVVLNDLYALDKDFNIKKESVNYQKLLCKNQSQYNIKESININDDEPEILQIYYTSGDIGIDNIEYGNEEINIEGVLFCKIMYVVADDNVPINVYEVPVPFEHSIDIKGLKETSIANITPNINYINCTMVSAKEVEIKCAVNMNTVVFDENSVEIISDVEERPFDMKEFHKLPGITGYVVKENDTLWNIAKRYKTKVASIQAINNKEDSNITKGEKLIIVKELQI